MINFGRESGGSKSKRPVLVSIEYLLEILTWIKNDTLANYNYD